MRKALNSTNIQEASVKLAKHKQHLLMLVQSNLLDRFNYIVAIAASGTVSIYDLFGPAFMVDVVLLGTQLLSKPDHNSSDAPGHTNTVIEHFHTHVQEGNSIQTA